MADLRVATANVLVSLDDDKARKALHRTLAQQPTVVGLQEWGRSRKPLLREQGRIFRAPTLRRRLGRPHPTTGWVFGYPLTGGQPVGVDASQAELLSVRRILLARPRKGLRATWGTEATIRLRATREFIPVLDTHLMAHHNDPAHLAAWEDGVAAIEGWSEGWGGYHRLVMGDMNKQGLTLHGLVSCWKGNPHEDTFRDRRIDEVFAIEEAADAEAISTPSDHDSVIATYPPRIKEK